MIALEENTTNLHNTKTQVTIGDSGTLTRKKRGDWHGYQKCDGILHHVTLFDMEIIPGLHTNLFSMERALKKFFQVTPEGEALIINKNSTNIFFDKKMENNGCEGFLPTTRFYDIQNDAALLAPNKQNMEGNSVVHP